MAVYSHNGDCFLLLVSKEIHGEERIHNEMETTQRKDTAGEDRENEGHITQAGVNS